VTGRWCFCPLPVTPLARCRCWSAAPAGRRCCWPGDLTYGAEILQRGQLPGVGNRRLLAESTRKVLALQHQQPGLVVLPAHDPTDAQRLLDS
jgi:hypothetical protein